MKLTWIFKFEDKKAPNNYKSITAASDMFKLQISLLDLIYYFHIDLAYFKVLDWCWYTDKLLLLIPFLDELSA